MTNLAEAFESVEDGRYDLDELNLVVKDNWKYADPSWGRPAGTPRVDVEDWGGFMCAKCEVSFFTNGRF